MRPEYIYWIKLVFFIHNKCILPWHEHIQIMFHHACEPKFNQSLKIILEHEEHYPKKLPSKT